MDDFELDVDLLIFLVEARPVLWDKTHDIYNDRNATKKALREICICLQEGFEALEDAKKAHLVSTAMIYWTRLIAVHKNLGLFHFMYSTVHIFDISQEVAPASVRK
jgi:hypothetical protein